MGKKSKKDKNQKFKIQSKSAVPLVGILPFCSDDYILKVQAAIPDFSDIVITRAQTDLEIKEMKEADGTALIYLSTRDLDHDGDIVTPGGWDLDIYKMNPKGLWSHDAKGDAIFTALETYEDDYGLMQRIQFAPTEKAQELWMLVQKGFLRTFSAGFQTLDRVWRDDEEFTAMLDQYEMQWPEFTHEMRKDVWRIVTEKRLFESSLCNIPCNPFALVQEIEEGNIKISDNMRKELKVEEYIKKGIDSGKLDKKYAGTKLSIKEKKEPSPDPAKKVEVKKMPVKVQSSVEIKEKIIIKEAVVPEALTDIVSKKVSETIDRKRGAV